MTRPGASYIWALVIGSMIEPKFNFIFKFLIGLTIIDSMLSCI